MAKKDAHSSAIVREVSRGVQQAHPHLSIDGWGGLVQDVAT
eukprot:gene9399-21314_t